MILSLLATSVAAAPGGDLRTVAFDTDLHLGADPILRGGSASTAVVLPRPRSFALAADPVVRIHFSHSATLDPAQSTLTLLLDDRAVATVRLGPANSGGGDLVAVLPRVALHDYNRLTLSATQHGPAGCESPFDPSLWTRISAQSSVELDGHAVPLPLQLIDFPAPLWDPLGTGPMRLTPVVTGAVGDATLDAAGELAFGLGRLADYRGVDMIAPAASLDAATTAALLVGTPAENPLIATLVDVSTLTPAQGFVALVPNPAHPELPVLVVTGGSGTAVRNAARALVRPDRAAWLAGARSLVEGDVPSRPPRSARLPRPLRTEEATLAELGIADHTSEGLFGAPLVVPLQLEGDARVRPGGTFTLKYAYGAGLDPRLSTLEVRVDGVGIRSVALSDPAGEEHATLRVALPANVVGPGSVLQVGFDLFPASLDPCVAVADRHLWGTVFADSAIALGRDDVAALPDLSLLRHRLWPFDAEGVGEHVAVVVGDHVGPDELAAGMQVVATLGARSTADGSPVRLLSAAVGEPGGLEILLVSRDRPNTLLPRSEQLAPAGGDPPDGIVVESQRAGPSATRLALIANDAASLLPLSHVLSDDAALEDLRGAAVTWTPIGGPRIFLPAGTEVVRRGSTLEQVRGQVEEHGGLLALFATPGALATALVASRWSRRRGGVT